MRSPSFGFRRQNLSSGWAILASVAVGPALGVTLLLAVSAREGPPPNPRAPEQGVGSPSPATRLPHLGLLLDLRDEALGRVISVPADGEAMDFLVRVQRLLAADNPEALRTKAKLYARASAGGLQAEEHLTAQAMRLLVLANLLAATQAEANSPAPPLPQAAVLAKAPVLAPAGAQTARFPARVQRLVPAAPAVAAPAATRDYFLVISPPLPVDRAQHEVGVLSIAGFSPLLRRTGDGLVQVQVGAFARQANAEALAARVRERGLLVSVVSGPASTAFERARPLPSPAAASPPAGHPQTFGTLMERGGRLYRAGWYGPALASFRQAARTRPDSARAHLWWGRAAFKVSRFSESREALRRTLDLSGETEIGRQARLLLQVMPAAGAATTAPGTE